MKYNIQSTIERILLTNILRPEDGEELQTLIKN